MNQETVIITITDYREASSGWLDRLKYTMEKAGKKLVEDQRTHNGTLCPTGTDRVLVFHEK